MSERLQRNIHWLNVLQQAKRRQRDKIFEVADKDLIECICEVCKNVIDPESCVTLTDKDRKCLQRHKVPIRHLCDKKLSVKKKRDLLVQSGGFIPALLAPVLAIAGSLLADLITNG